MKLTPSVLRTLVLEEVAKLKSEKLKSDGPKETDADEYADSLENHIDFLKALKIKESRLAKQLNAVREQKARVVKKLTDS